MKKILILCAAACLPLALWAGVDDDEVAGEMATGARQFLSGLETYQRAPATFDYEDEERFDFHYIPRERAGVALKSLSPAQRLLAHRLLATALSPRGMQRALDIMFLEKILFEAERRPIRDPDLYYFTVFGEPSSDSDWGFRVEGHHLSLNVSLRDGRLASTSPLFMGSNPAEVRDGDHLGMKALPDEEALGRELLRSFSPADRSRVVIEPEAPRDMLTAASREVELRERSGLPYRAMSGEQQELLLEIVESYARRLRQEIAEAELARIRAAGLDDIHFAWAGSATPGEGHYYRVHGPTFLIEYDNVQNEANHIHSVWRDLTGDFGLTEDPLARHYRDVSHE